MISTQNTALLVIDVQERLMPVIDCGQEVSSNVSILVQGMNILNVPVFCTEQYPERLGATVSDVKQHLECQVVSKLSFSCCGVEKLNNALETSGRTNIIVAGVETHVCVYQTVLDLLERGCTPYVVTDAVSSRTVANKEVALAEMTAAGARLTSVEMALFELLGSAQGDAFKQILGLVK